MRSPDTSTWHPFWRRWWSSVITTPGDDVLCEIARLWPLRRDPVARAILKVWIAVHRAQEAM